MAGQLRAQAAGVARLDRDQCHLQTVFDRVLQRVAQSRAEREQQFIEALQIKQQQRANLCLGTGLLQHAGQRCVQRRQPLACGGFGIRAQPAQVGDDPHQFVGVVAGLDQRHRTSVQRAVAQRRGVVSGPQIQPRDQGPGADHGGESAVAGCRPAAEFPHHHVGRRLAVLAWQDRLQATVKQCAGQRRPPAATDLQQNPQRRGAVASVVARSIQERRCGAVRCRSAGGGQGGGNHALLSEWPARP